jgi:hypothetical protein
VAQQVSVEHHSSNDVAGVGAHAVGNEDKDVGIRDRVQEVRRLTRDTFHVDNAVGVNPRDRVREVQPSIAHSRHRAVEHHLNGEAIQHAMSPKTAQRRAHEGLESNEG